MENFRIADGWANGRYYTVALNGACAQLVKVQRVNKQNIWKTECYEVRSTGKCEVFAKRKDAFARYHELTV